MNDAAPFAGAPAAAPAVGRVARGLHLAVLGGLLATLLFGILVPVYSDEIGWRFQERAWVDGIDKAYSDLCGLGTYARPPWFMMPIRWYSAAANQALADPLFVRLEGVACAMALVALLWLLTKRLEGDPTRRRGLQTLVFALLGIGTLPLLLVMSRPEQPLLLAFTLIILIALTRPAGVAATWLRVASIVLLSGIATSYHLKGVAYSPIALACILVCATGRRTLIPRLLGAGALVAMTAAAASYWIERFQCHGDAVVTAKLNGENLASALGAGMSLPEFLMQALRGANPLLYAVLSIPNNLPMSSWLPEKMFPAAVPIVFAAVILLAWGAAFLLALAALGRSLLRDRLACIRQPRTVIALAVLACMMVWGASQLNRNVYEAAHVLPFLAMFIALCLTLPGGRAAWVSRGLAWIAPTVAAAALLSEIAVIGFTAAPLLAAAQTPGALPAQPFSVSIAGYGKVRSDIVRAMALAGMDGRAPLPRLMVDDVTYLALQRHPLPFHNLGVTDVWSGSIDNPARYLLSRNSSGVVVPCRHLPMELESAAAVSGQICAINRSQLQVLAAPPPSLWGDE